MEDIFAGLTEEQAAAVQHVGTPLLIVAGAGTGKTTVLTRRIAHMIRERAIPARAIMAVTFTEKAATEITDRLEKYVAAEVPDMWVGTFHGMCERILRQHGHHIGLPMNFRVLSASETWMFLRNNFEKFPLTYFRPRGNPTKFLQALLSHFSRCKDELVSPEAYVTFAQNAVLDTDTPSEQMQLEQQKYTELAGAYTLYEKRMLEAGCLDFGSLLYYTYELFRTRKNILGEYQRQFKEILVDEFQDTNTVQYAILKQLCDPQTAEGPHITVVGDDNQSIYGFRGAVIENILQFSKDFSNTTSIVLLKNYRTKQNILDHAWQLIQHNNPHTLEAQLGINKKLVAMRPTEGEIAFTQYFSEHHENTGIAQQLEAAHATGIPWGEMAILVRAHGHADLLRKKISEKGIPLIVHGRTGVLNHPIVLHCMQVLRTWYNLHDSSSLYGLLTVPPLQLSSGTLSALTHESQKRCISLYDALKIVSTLGCSEEEVRRIDQFLSLVNETTTQPAGQQSLRAQLIHWLEAAGTMEYWQKEKEFGRLEEPFVALEGFLLFIEQFERTHVPATRDVFIRFYDDALLLGDEGVEQEIEMQVDAVHIMSIHGAKGLEFTQVFIPSMIQQRFPTADRSDRIPIPAPLLRRPVDERSEHLLEERRLCYVAMTRARNVLFLSAATYYNESKTKRKPSRFISEMEVPLASENDGVASEKSEVVATEKTPSVAPRNEIGSLSFSQLQTFLRCPLQYKYRYILSIPTLGSYARSFGTTMHTALQAWYTLLKERRSIRQQDLFGKMLDTLQPEEPGLEALLEIYKEKWVDEWYENPGQKKEYWERGLTILKAYYEKFHPFAQLPAAIEQSFSIEVGNCTFTGRIDRMDTNTEGAVIIDYKTGRPKTRLEKEDRQQLLLYYLASLKDQRVQQYGRVVSLQYWYLDDLSIQEVTASSETILTFEGEIKAVVEEMKHSDFPATPDPQVCRYCDFKNICPLRKL